LAKIQSLLGQYLKQIGSIEGTDNDEEDDEEYDDEED